MSSKLVCLAGAWNPRGEFARLIEQLPSMREVYCGVALVVPPGTGGQVLDGLSAQPKLETVVAQDWSWGRHLSLARALDFPGDHIQYADMDRLLRWIETRPQEWRDSVSEIPGHDCVIFGRTEGAYATHPQAIFRTEAISNQVFSNLFGQPVDLSAGSKGFSRRAVEFLVANSQPGRALGMDAQWPMLLYKAGYELEMRWVEGLDWESADRYRSTAADQEAQQMAASTYDLDPENWAYRVEVAMEIVSAGLEVIGPS